jgi:hypothetical protein
MKKRHEFEVVRNHDYTITVKDSKGRKILFRDITGQDLEYLDLILDNEGQEINEEQKRVSFDDIQNILTLLSIDRINFGLFTQRIIIGIFNCVKEHILCNYIPKYSWLKACYGIQNGSFVNVLEMEKVPMTKFIAMTQIHKDAMDSIKND